MPQSNNNKNILFIFTKKIHLECSFRASTVPTKVSLAQENLRALCWALRVLFSVYTARHQKCISNSKLVTDLQGPDRVLALIKLSMDHVNYFLVGLI